MSWTEIDLTQVSTQMEILPKGEYTFQVLPGAKFGDNDPGRVEARVAVAQGEQAGRQLFISYPDPAKKDWSPRVFKRLVESLGADINAGETPVQYLNRVAGLRFDAPVDHSKDNEGVDRANLNIFKVRPSQN